MGNRRDLGSLLLQLVDSLSVSELAGYFESLLVSNRGHQEHVGALLVLFQLEILVGVLLQHDRSEGSEALAELDLEVDGGLHLRIPRIAQDATRPKSARPKFHRVLEPADDLAFRNGVSGELAQRVIVVDAAVVRGHRTQKSRDLIVRVGFPEKGPALRVASGGRTGVSEQLMPDKERNAQCAARVPRGGLDPDILERAFAENSAIADAIQCNTTG